MVCCGPSCSRGGWRWQGCARMDLRDLELGRIPGLPYTMYGHRTAKAWHWTPLLVKKGSFVAEIQYCGTAIDGTSKYVHRIGATRDSDQFRQSYNGPRNMWRRWDFGLWSCLDAFWTQFGTPMYDPFPTVGRVPTQDLAAGTPGWAHCSPALPPRLPKPGASRRRCSPQRALGACAQAVCVLGACAQAALPTPAPVSTQPPAFAPAFPPPHTRAARLRTGCSPHLLWR